MAAKKVSKWKCPKCGAPANGHGEGECGSPNAGAITCSGLLCECDQDAQSSRRDHGETTSNPCPNANCYHCGFSGTVPQEKMEDPIVLLKEVLKCDFRDGLDTKLRARIEKRVRQG
jgi:hypothetical protein